MVRAASIWRMSLARVVSNQSCDATGPASLVPQCSSKAINISVSATLWNLRRL